MIIFSHFEERTLIKNNDLVYTVQMSVNGMQTMIQYKRAEGKQIKIKYIQYILL